MIVIIPHPDNELKIVNFQNELTNNIYKTTNCNFFKHFPLWIPLSPNETNTYETIKSSKDEKKLLKTIGSTIKKVTLGKLQYENNQIYLKVTISIEKENEKKDFSEKLILLTGCKTNKKEELIQYLSEYPFPEETQLKIFRIGLVHTLSANSTSISDSIWCKLK